MPMFPRITVLAVIVASAVLLSGCVAPDPDPTPSPSPSASPVFASEEEALAAATEAYAAYQAMSDLIFGEGGSDPTRIEQVAIGPAREAALSSFEAFAESGYRISGATTFNNISTQQYLPGDPTAVLSVYLCLDISAVDVLDKANNSMVSPDRPDTQAYAVTFAADPTKTARLVVAERDAWTGGGVCPT